MTNKLPMKLAQRIHKLDQYITEWMAKYGILLLRVSVGIVFFWFGILKFFPNLSPAEAIAGQTVEVLTFGIIKPVISLPTLAVWETLIGIGLITGRFMRFTLLLLFLQMVGTIMPIFLLPEETFTSIPIAPTLEGQYIIKNLIILSAGIVLGATVRGGFLISDPKIVEQQSQPGKQRSTV